MLVNPKKNARGLRISADPGRHGLVYDFVLAELFLPFPPFSCLVNCCNTIHHPRAIGRRFLDELSFADEKLSANFEKMRTRSIGRAIARVSCPKEKINENPQDCESTHRCSACDCDGYGSSKQNE